MQMAYLVPAEPQESAQFLSGLAQAKGLDIGDLLGGILGGGGQGDGSQGFSLGGLKPEQITAILTLLPLILGLLKNASGGGAGVPGELPTPPKPPAPKPPTPKEEEDDEPDTPESGERDFAGLKGKYGNFQRGKAGGGVRADPAREVEVFERGANIFGPEKTKFIMYLTPVMDDGEGLRPGDDENDDIEVDFYGIEFDGKEYVGDAMKELSKFGIVMNNMDSSNGMNPRIVIDGCSGDHTLAGFASVNGHKWKGKTLNIKGQK